METLKSSFKHIASTLDATCISTRAQHTSRSTTTASSASVSHSQSGEVNTSLARILADHHRIRGSALRCLMTALDIDRLAIDKAYRHIALLHGAGQHREAGQAERAMRGYPPLLEVLHVVLEKNGVEEWDRWTRREENAERDEALGKYVPFPFTPAATDAQRLPAPVAHLLPTLAERQIYDDPLPSSPPRSPPRTLQPPLASQLHNHSSHKQTTGAAVDSSQRPEDEVLLIGAMEADERARERRLAARRERDRQQRLEAKKRLAIQQAQEAKVEADEEEEVKEGKEEKDDVKDGALDADKERTITVDDEVDAEVQQLTAMIDDGAVEAMPPLDGGSPSSGLSRPMRPQLLASVSHSPTEAYASLVNGVENGNSGFVSPYSAASPQPVNGDPLDAYAATNGDSPDLPVSLSSSSSLSPSFSTHINVLHAANNHSTQPSTQTITRPARTRKKAPRYGEDDLYVPNEPRPRSHRPSPSKLNKPPPQPEHDDEKLWEIDTILCYRFRAYPPFHQLAGSAYRSFLLLWKGYPRATWVMEDDLVSVEKRQMERLPEYDEWRLMSASANVEVEEEEPWVSGGEDGSSKAHAKRRRTGPRIGSLKRKRI